MPLLFLSARGEDGDKLRGLALGADDYTVKSATPAEVVARVKAVMRRASNGRSTSRRSYGRLEVDLAAHEALVDGEPVALTAREFELLTLFVTHPRQALTREQIFEQVWGSWGDRSVVSVYVRRLRDKLEADPRHPQMLVTLWGSLEAIERGVGDGRYLNRAQDKAAHLDRLVSDLFTFSRLEHAGEVMAEDEVDVAEVVRRAAETVEPLAASRGCALEVQGGAARAAVRGAAARGDQPARQRHPPRAHARHACGGAPQRVVRVEVADDGPGFAQDDLTRVFDPLFRSDRARGGATGGTGLGLAIARRLARAHGGDVEAANAPGGGARATLTLPSARS